MSVHDPSVLRVGVHQEEPELSLLSAGEVVEVPLLLTSQQLCALEQAASQRGWTTGELMRHAVQNFLGSLVAKAPCPGRLADMGCLAQLVETPARAVG